MGLKMIDSFDPISCLSLLSASKLVFDTHEVHEVAALSLLSFCIKRPAAAALNARIPLKPKRHKRQKECTKGSYCDDVNCSFETYNTDGIVAKTDDDKM